MIGSINSSGALVAQSKKPCVLLRSSWQTVNIGDIAHTPGVLHMLERLLPEVGVKLWPSDTRNGVREMLQARFPKVGILSRSQLKQAYEECDFLLHGSGPHLVAEKHVKDWVEKTGKPYGVFGISLSKITNLLKETLSQSKFIYFRDSKSLAYARSQGVSAPIMEFGPDGAFAIDLRNEEKAQAFMRENELEEKNFMCCIPRYRFTPYWKIKDRPFNEAAHQRNEEMKELDHAPMRKAIIDLVEKTKMKVLLCPEDKSQMEIGKEMIYDRLPKSILNRIVWRENYWLTDEALTIYTNSAGLFGLEMHSPIMCIGNGIPAVVCRFKEQTTKGFMWEDIGLGDWLFDMDRPEQVSHLGSTVLKIAQNPKWARQRVLEANEKVKNRQKSMCQTLNKHLMG